MGGFTAISAADAFPTALTPADVAAMDEALRRCAAAADEAEAKAGDTEGAWATVSSWVIGNESAVQGAQSSAIATRNAYNALRNKRALIQSHEQAAAFIQACAEIANVSDILLVVQQTSLVNAARQVGAWTLEDLKNKALPILGVGLPILGLVAAGVVALAVAVYLPRVRA